MNPSEQRPPESGPQTTSAQSAILPEPPAVETASPAIPPGTASTGAWWLRLITAAALAWAGVHLAQRGSEFARTARQRDAAPAPALATTAPVSDQKHDTPAPNGVPQSHSAGKPALAPTTVATPDSQPAVPTVPASSQGRAVESALASTPPGAGQATDRKELFRKTVETLRLLEQ